MDLISRENVNKLYLETFYSVDHFNYNNGQKFRFLKKIWDEGASQSMEDPIFILF